MRRFYTQIIKNILIVAMLASPLMLMAGEAETQAANELLDTMHYEKVMDDAINASVQIVKQMDPNMGKHEATLRKFYEKHMSTASLRTDVIKIYSETFSAKELKDITAFYKTETGQKTLEKMPEIMQKSMQIAQTRVMQNMGKLQEMLAKEQAAK